MATAAQGGRMRPQTFGDAFREARLAGDKTFEFKGETYSTKTAEEQGREIAQTASGSGRGAPAGRTAADRDTAPMRTEAPASAPPARPARPARPRASMSDIPGLIARGMSEGAERVPAGRGLGAAFTAAGATRGAGQLASRAIQGLRGAKAAENWRDRPPEGTDPAKWREIVRKVDASYPGGAAPASAAREAAESAASRIDPLLSTSRTRETGRFRPSEAPLSRAREQAREEMAAEPQFKRGGKIQAYAKGGSVRGAGIAQRGVKKCKVY